MSRSYFRGTMPIQHLLEFVEKNPSFDEYQSLLQYIRIQCVDIETYEERLHDLEKLCLAHDVMER